MRSRFLFCRTNILCTEDNDVLFDKDMQSRVLDFCSDKYEMVKTKKHLLQREERFLSVFDIPLYQRTHHRGKTQL